MCFFLCDQTLTDRMYIENKIFRLEWQMFRCISQWSSTDTHQVIIFSIPEAKVPSHRFMDEFIMGVFLPSFDSSFYKVLNRFQALWPRHHRCSTHLQRAFNIDTHGGSSK